MCSFFLFLIVKHFYRGADFLYGVTKLLRGWVCDACSVSFTSFNGGNTNGGPLLEY